MFFSPFGGYPRNNGFSFSEDSPLFWPGTLATRHEKLATSQHTNADDDVTGRPRPERQRRDRAAERYAEHQPALERLWLRWLARGRRPEKSEVEYELELTDGFGSIGKALRFVENRKALDSGSDEVARALARARAARSDELTVYFALNQFQRRRPYAHLEDGLKRDIKHFFGDYRQAQTAGLALLLDSSVTMRRPQAIRRTHWIPWR